MDVTLFCLLGFRVEGPGESLGGIGALHFYFRGPRGLWHLDVLELVLPNGVDSIGV